MVGNSIARSLAATIVLGAALAGCAAVPQFGSPTPVGPSLLERADQQLASGDYRGAIGLYDEFLRAASHDREARRVVATRTALAHLLRLEAVVQDLRQQSQQRDQELGAAQNELAALRGEIQRARQELGRLRLVDAHRERLESKVALCEEALLRLQYQVRAVRAETSRVRENLERLKLIDLELEQRVR
jgi:hypothetical protein